MKRLAVAVCALLLLAVPVVAAAQQMQVPPQGTLVIAVGVSDGMVVLPAGLVHVPGLDCGPMAPAAP